MNRAEWKEAVALMRVNWPHVTAPEGPVEEKWFRDLQHLPGDQVKVAIETFYRDGERFPPNGAQILRKINELSRADLSVGEAWRLAHRAARIADPKEAQRWLEERCPPAAEAVRQISGPFLSYMKADESTVRAQFRDIYRNVIAAQRRDDLYAGLPNAGLRGLERGPRKLGSVLSRALPPALVEARSEKGAQ